MNAGLADILSNQSITSATFFESLHLLLLNLWAHISKTGWEQGRSWGKG